MGRTKDQIVEEMRSELNENGLNVQDHITTPVSMAYVESTAHQIEMAEYYAETIRKHFFIADDEGDGLDKRLNERGLSPRFLGYNATGNIILGKNTPFIIGSLIAKDMIFKTLDAKISLRVTQDTNIVPGTTSATVPVECTEVGNIGNLLPNTPLTYSGVAINEVEFVRVDAVGLAGGKVAETDDDVKQRLQEDKQQSSTSGNQANYIKWAKETKDSSGAPVVGDAQAVYGWNGDFTIKVFIIDLNKLPASPEVVAIVQSYLDPEASGLGDGAAPFGAKCTVVPADSVVINISAHLTLKPGYTAAQTTDIFTAAFNEYRKSISFQQDDTVRYSRIGILIGEAEGVIDYTDLTVNNGTANVDVPEGSVPVLGAVTFT